MISKVSSGLRVDGSVTLLFAFILKVSRKTRKRKASQAEGMVWSRAQGREQWREIGGCGPGALEVSGDMVGYDTERLTKDFAE